MHKPLYNIVLLIKSFVIKKFFKKYSWLFSIKTVLYFHKSLDKKIETEEKIWKYNSKIILKIKKRI